MPTGDTYTLQVLAQSSRAPFLSAPIHAAARNDSTWKFGGLQLGPPHAKREALLLDQQIPLRALLGHPAGLQVAWANHFRAMVYAWATIHSGGEWQLLVCGSLSYNVVYICIYLYIAPPLPSIGTKQRILD